MNKMKYGVDLASYQDKINMKKVKENNSFAIFKVSEGTNYVDIPLKEELSDARKIGLRVGFYHFARFDKNSGTSEAKYFYGKVENIIANGDTIWLDYEASSLGHKNKIRDFINEIQGLFNKKIKCGLYCSVNPFNSENLGSVVYSYTPLWIASYGAEPMLNNAFVDIWQYRDDYKVGSYTCDRNKYLFDDWKKWNSWALNGGDVDQDYYYLKRVAEYKPRYASDHEKAYIVTPTNGQDRNIYLDKELQEQWGNRTLHNTTHVYAYPTANIEREDYTMHVMKYFDEQYKDFVYIKYAKLYK